MAQINDHPRGIFSTRYGAPDGSEVMIAVDSNSRRVAEAVVSEQASRQRIVLALRELLDEIDPPTPPLHLVGDESELLN